MHPTQFLCGTSVWIYSKRIANFCDFIHGDRKNSLVVAFWLLLDYFDFRE